MFHLSGNYISLHLSIATLTSVERLHVVICDSDRRRASGASLSVDLLWLSFVFLPSGHRWSLELDPRPEDLCSGWLLSLVDLFLSFAVNSICSKWEFITPWGWDPLQIEVVDLKEQTLEGVVHLCAKCNVCADFCSSTQTEHNLIKSMQENLKVPS